MKFYLFIFLLLHLFMVNAQHKCASQYLYNKKLQENALLKEAHRLGEEKMAQLLLNNHLENPKLSNASSHKNATVITIPVVVHVVYNTPVQNISSEQIRKQISKLNEDYRSKNSNLVDSTHPFWPLVADAEYEFCLATKDPSGNPTNGITRTSTTITGFDADVNGDDVKFNITGGHDNWNPNLYLNIWVCNLINGVLGYSTFPDELSFDPDLDGVVIGYRFFGVGGTAIAPNDIGRTATHEIGHWLGLYHPCESSCDDDLVSDTPPCEELNYGCPTFPHRPNNACGSTASGEMYMNFMDYVDDACMSMFTFQQTVRMHNKQSLYRSSIPTANKCISTASVQDEEKLVFSIYPNPSDDFIEVYLGNEQNLKNPQIAIVDALGKEVYSIHFQNTSTLEIPIQHLSNGSYYIILSDGVTKTTKVFNILH